MKKWLRLCALLWSLMACGRYEDLAQVKSSSLKAPANQPVLLECRSWDGAKARSFVVDWEDLAPLRLCYYRQYDGALALDLRLRPNLKHVKRPHLKIELSTIEGKQRTGIFPFVFDPMSGSYAVTVSQGCLIGAPEGCARFAPPAMRQLWEGLAAETGEFLPDLEVKVHLLKEDAISPFGPMAQFSFLHPQTARP